jgi:Putative auto-transporter adhesin, head GIN domain
MNTTRIALFMMLVLSVAGCGIRGIRGNGHITTDQRTVTEFSEIDAGGAMQIEWTTGAPSLSITTDENLLSRIDTEVIGKRLRLNSHGNFWPTKGIKIAVASPVRIGARLSGATKLTATQLSGGRFAIESSGATTVTLDGKIDELLADMTGASKLNAGSLQTKIAEIATTGAAKADVAVSDSLKVSITGAGKVTYSGNPPSIEKNITGAGKIQHKE